MLVVDLGGVAARFRPERRLAELAARTGLAPAVVHERIWASGIDDAASRGELGRDETYERVLAALDHRIDEVQLLDAWALAFEPNPDVLAWARGGALLSNNGPLLEDCLPDAITDAFGPILLSWRLGACKPDPAIFAAAADVLGTDDLELVDDEPANVEAARRAGWRARLFSEG